MITGSTQIGPQENGPRGAKFDVLSGRKVAAIEIIMAALAALVTVVQQGFRFGVSNNLFHIPFVLRWNELPAFKDDMFYQTLPSFTSGFWWLLRLAATERWLSEIFLLVHVAGRVGAFFALALLLRSLVPHLRWRLAVLLLLAACPLLKGGSLVGASGLFVDQLSHSEFVWPFVLLAFACAVQQKWPQAAGWAALTFTCNAFVGIWVFLALAPLVLADRGAVPSARWGVSASIYLAGCLPVFAWIVSATSGLASGTPFSFLAYIRTYYPQHFLIEATDPGNLISMVALCLCAILACSMRGWSRWRTVLLALAVVFVVGIPLPYLIDNRFVFNLHLLRVGGVIQFLSVVLCAAAAASWFGDEDSWPQLMAGGLLIGLVTGEFIPIALLLAIGAARRGSWWPLPVSVLLASVGLGNGLAIGLEPFEIARAMVWVFAGASIASLFVAGPRWRMNIALTGAALILGILAVTGASYGRVAGLVCLILLIWQAARAKMERTEWSPFGNWTARAKVTAPLVFVVGFSCLLLRADRASFVDDDSIAAKPEDWKELAQWCKTRCPDGIVLLPANERDYGNFQLLAKASVWVDWKQGAAVMWEPSFYATWHLRFEETRSLNTPEDQLAYATARNLPLVVAERQPGAAACPSPSIELFGNASFAICQVPMRGPTVQPNTASTVPGPSRH